MIAALRNYLSIVFLRENPLVITAVWIIASSTLMAVFQHGDPIALLDHDRGTVYLLWGSCWILPSVVLAQYWRQVLAPHAPAVPGLLIAELRAALVMLVVVIAVIDAPLARLGAPISGLVALTLVGVVISGSMVPPLVSARGMPGPLWLWATRLRLALLAGVVLFGFQNHWFGWLVAANPALTIPLSLLMIAVIIGVLWRVPTFMRHLNARSTTRPDLQQSRPTPARLMLARLANFVRWRPGFWPDAPVPAQFALATGPIGLLINIAVQYAIIFGVDFAVYHNMASTRATGLHMAAEQSMALVAGLTVAQLSQSLLNRSGFALTFLAGRYGGRAQYSQSVFRIFLINGFIRCAVVAVVGMSIAAALHMVSIEVAIIDGLLILATMLGSSLFGALPLLWHDFGGIGVAAFCAMSGYLFCYSGVFAALTATGMFVIAVPAVIATIAVIGGAIIWMFAPGRLATMDWPIDTEAV
ncbi:MAG TPA: hypothetical protein PK677_06240 [Acidiphilium sp.]|nr:MAG: hypothetical protein B7Z67_11465 [Acidiphilium sp. 21-60-14]OYV90644.1 MAG: hypothetical protein B7Z57_08495 [Acidiphilium sp. 37-60-79]OZB38565.1 MAG: hypothetical protein B7X48_12700 [Acidiphilium sp. 34-60-192]HQT88138.1 hypothetical protein [Acidiphilium sp.]HQU24242.1 hypothetical protein [Acidiphilium sp.]